MIETEMVVHVFSGASLLEAATFERLFAALQRPPVSALQFGSAQPLRPYTRGDVHEALEDFEENFSLLLSGNYGRFTGSIRQWPPENFGRWYFRFCLAEWDSRWRAWLLDVVRDVPILFGVLCPGEEWEEKHGVHERIPGRLGSRHALVGAKDKDLYNWLPGIYWCTIFGRELTSSLDFTRAAQIPGVTVSSLDDQHTVVQLDGSPFVDGDALDQRLALERCVADAIAPEHFFDRERPTDRLRQVPALSAR